MEISGIRIDIRRKNIKNLHIRVDPAAGSVAVSVPLGMSDAEAERFIRSKLGWIRARLAEAGQRTFRPSKEFISGGELWVWGQRYALRTLAGERDSLVLGDGEAALTLRPGNTPDDAERFVREWCRELLGGEIARRLPEWEAVTGLKAAEWRIKNMTTRWGTCNIAERRIWLSLQLAKRPPECLDHVILHELLHLADRRHDKRFYAMMDRYMPDWRAVRARLNGLD